MAKNRKKRDPTPEQYDSFDELANFGETHDLTDYEDQLEEVNYKIARKPTRQFVVTLSDELTKALRKATHREGGFYANPHQFMGARAIAAISSSFQRDDFSLNFGVW